MTKQKKVHSKADIIKHVLSSVDGVSKATVVEIVDVTLNRIKQAVASDEKVILIGFGTFEQGIRKAFVGRNPQTGKEIKIPSAKGARFRAGKNFKELLNK